MEKYDWALVIGLIIASAIKLGVVAFVLYLAWLLVTGIIA